VSDTHTDTESECESQSQSDSGRGGQKNYELVDFKYLPDF